MKTITYIAALSKFIELLTARNHEYYSKHYPNVIPPTYTVSTGQKNDKIVTNEESGGRSVYCFIDRNNGDILKAASWKAPAKHARGNIFNDDPLQGTTIHGVIYLKG